MKILVTGGTVFISRYTAEYFAAKGHEVYVLNRNTRPQSKGVKLIECDRNDIGGKLKNIHFDAVIDVTAYTAEDINNLLDGLESFDNYVMISTSAVYPETLEQPYKESDGLGENRYWGAYGSNKIAAEKALLKRVPNASIIRPCYVYGEYNNLYRESFVFDCAEQDKPFYVPNDGKMPLQFFHVEDLCRLIEIILIKRPAKKIFNVGNEPVTITEWVEACYRAVGKAPELIYVNNGAVQHKYFPFLDYGYVLDVTAQNELLPDLIPLDEGLRRSYEWYKLNRELVKKRNFFDYIENNIKEVK
ncbi:MAG: NAD-dependent epimerase/dehydratase family protein [Clostridiales bacterium]|nr:NAD-dependent epimerase/dehydratase family protein [Clostridiales bacterium]